MTDHEAARLAEIRDIASQLSPSPGDVRQALDDAVRLLDAAARPHDASFVSRAMYDAAIAERDDAQARSGIYMGHECCVCGFPIHGVMIGMGDGTGQRFGHRDCYERERAEAAELKVAMLEKALAERGGRRVAELERDVDGYKQTVSLQYERGDRLAAALAASKAKLCVALRDAKHMRQVIHNARTLIHEGDAVECAWHRDARAALRPAEEK